MRSLAIVLALPFALCVANTAEAQTADVAARRLGRVERRAAAVAPLNAVPAAPVTRPNAVMGAIEKAQSWTMVIPDPVTRVTVKRMPNRAIGVGLSLDF